MLKIFAKILLFVLPAAIAVVITGNNFSQGFIDYHYTKITGEGKSLVIGTSRASQGIIPNMVIQGSNYDGPMLNFAFTTYNSPYDEGYYYAIEKKLNPSVKNGIFILEIDPLAIADNKKDKSPSKLLSQQWIFHGNPNYEYLYRNINPFYTLILRNNESNPNCIPNKDGWLKIILSEDSVQARERGISKLNTLEQTLPSYKISPRKIAWLEKTISLLKQHGKVILIRIPAWKPIIDAENKNFTALNQIVLKICKSYNVRYFDFTPFSQKYKYIDGNHLDGTSVKLFSKELNRLILSN